MLNLEDIPTDAELIGTETDGILTDDLDYMGNAGVILGQLDPTEIDLTTGQPRWSEPQRELIIKFNDMLREWRDL